MPIEAAGTSGLQRTWYFIRWAVSLALAVYIGWSLHNVDLGKLLQKIGQFSPTSALNGASQGAAAATALSDNTAESLASATPDSQPTAAPQEPTFAEPSANSATIATTRHTTAATPPAARPEPQFAADTTPPPSDPAPIVSAPATAPTFIDTPPTPTPAPPQAYAPGFGGGGGGSTATPPPAETSPPVPAPDPAPATTTLAAPAVLASDCDLSLVASTCVLPYPLTPITWSDVPGAATYTVVINGIPGAALTATSSTVSLSSNATTTIAVAAYDSAGNSATSTPIEIYEVERPVVINEIGWAGDGDPSHQWIELENVTNLPIDLSRFSIQRSGGGPIALSGTFDVTDPYFVVERVPLDSTGPQKSVVPFEPLSVSGERLALTWNGREIDATPDVVACQGWCAGSPLTTLGGNLQLVPSLSTPLSMERTSDGREGSIVSNWHTTDSYGPSLGISGTYVWGTPGTDNSSGLPTLGVYCGSLNNLLTRTGANTPFNLGSSGCTYLSRFITSGALRFGALYRGAVGSSTLVSAHDLSTSIVSVTDDALPPDAVAGEHFFFVIGEERTPDSGADRDALDSFVTASDLSNPPAIHFTIIPFTYDPTK